MEIEGRKAMWRMPPPLAAGIAERAGTSRMVAHLLFERGFTTPKAIKEFLQGLPPEHDPLLLPDMKEAATRIKSAAAAGEKVAIWGDFDADGLTASAVLLEAFRRLGLAPRVVIPGRDEGHGLRSGALAELARDGVSLTVTADCGVGDIEAAVAARAAGSDLIITDHHQPPPDGSLPRALVVCPTRLDSRYPFPRLAGSGVAYKLAQALLEEPDAYESLLDLVALGTVADVVPLRDENRTLVARGLDRLRGTPRQGLRALFKVAGVSGADLDGTSIGFFLGPRINAANRMADPNLAFRLITSTDPAEAGQLAATLNDYNNSRQEHVERGVAAALELVGLPRAVKEAIRERRHDPIICVAGEWGTGISGLIASDLADRYCVPAMVGSARPDGSISVSARSVAGVSALEILRAAYEAGPSAFLDPGGGHEAACGFRTSAALLPAAFEHIGIASRTRVPIENLVPSITVDAQVGLHQTGIEALTRVESLAPYGEGFEAPVFMARRICLSSKQRAGAGGRHLKMTARDGNRRVSAILYNSDPEIADIPERQLVDLVFNLQRNTWNGTFVPEIVIRDWRLSQ